MYMCLYVSIYICIETYICYFSDFDSVLWLCKRIYQCRETHKYHASQMLGGRKKKVIYCTCNFCAF